MKNGALLPAAVLAVGLTLAGWLAGSGFEKGRLGDRFVTVKGVSEREVKADLALWPLRFVAAGNDLSAAQATIDTNLQRTLAFLEEQGVDTTQVSLEGLRVTDALANPYAQSPAATRFIITQTLIVRSADPDRVVTASGAIGELVEAGVVVSSGAEYGPGGPTLLFTGLNDLKPEMIAEATARAREAAEEFAEDSGSRIRGIRRANQGVFVILARDQAPGIQEQNQLYKTVRVVSTIEYLLRD